MRIQQQRPTRSSTKNTSSTNTMRLSMATIASTLIASLLMAHGANAFSLASLSIRTPTTLLGTGGAQPLRSSLRLASSAAATASDTSTTIQQADSVVCGGGPAGLLTAIMLAQKFPTQTVQLYDRLSEPPAATDESVWNDVAKFYLIGLGGRGQDALKEFGVWDIVEAACVAVLGRKDWAPDAAEGTERVFTKKDKKVTTQVLPRDKLVAVLHQHIQEQYAGKIELNYGYEVQPVDFNYNNNEAVLIQVAKCADDGAARLNPSAVKTATEEQGDMLCDTDNAVQVSTGLLIAADGTVRTIANAMEREDEKRFAAMNPLRRLFAGKPFHVKRYVDDNQRIYKTVPMKLPADWRPDLNYSARTKGGRINYDALPANANGDYCGVLLLKKDDSMAQADTDPVELRQLMDESLPQFSALLDDEVIAQVAQKPVSYLPGFRYAGPRLNQGDHCLMLGDSAHTVKPYFGLGANSALEDVMVLSEIIDATETLPEAVREFSKNRAPESKALVRISRELDRPGSVGFVTFILPIILDSIFSGIFPKLFGPNIITMLQRQEYTFQQVARRKRFDRLGQVAIIVGGLTGTVVAAKLSVVTLAKVIGKSSTTVATGASLAVAAGYAVSRLAKYLVPGMAPADVLTKLSGKDADDNKVSNGQSFVTPLGFGNQKEAAKE